MVRDVSITERCSQFEPGKRLEDPNTFSVTVPDGSIWYVEDVVNEVGNDVLGAVLPQRVDDFLVLDLVWENETSGDTILSALILDDVLYVGDRDREIHAVDISDGSVIYTLEEEEVEDRPSGMHLFDGKIYAGTQSETVLVFDQDEEEIDRILFDGEVGEGGRYDGQVLVENELFISVSGSTDSQGRVIWDLEQEETVKKELTGDSYGELESDGSRLFTTGPDHLTAWDLDWENILWEAEDLDLRDIEVNDGDLYGVSSEGELYEIDTGDGSVIREEQLDVDGEQFAAMAITGNELFLNNDIGTNSEGAVTLVELDTFDVIVQKDIGPVGSVIVAEGGSSFPLGNFNGWHRRVDATTDATGIDDFPYVEESEDGFVDVKRYAYPGESVVFGVDRPDIPTKVRLGVREVSVE